MNNSSQHGSISQITFERPVMKRGKYNKPTPEQIGQLIWLISKDYSVAQAARVVGVPYNTAYNHIAKKAMPKAEHPKRIHRTQKQIRKDAIIIRDMIAEGKTAKQIASEMGLTRGAIEHQIVRHKLRSKAKRKPRIVYAKPTFWQKCKRIISNLWG